MRDSHLVEKGKQWHDVDITPHGLGTVQNLCK